MVGHNQRNLNGQLSRLDSEQEIIQAVPNLGHHDQHPPLLRHRPDLVRDVVLFCQRGKGWPKVLGRLGRGRTKVHPHEEFFACWVGELLQVQNVVPLASKYAGHGVHDARLVRAGQGEDVFVRHC